MTDSGLGDKISGTAKEAAGKVTGDKDLEAEGKLDKLEGAVKEKLDDAGAGLKAVGEKIKDVFDKDK